MLQKISISNKCCHGIMALDHVTLKTGGMMLKIQLWSQE